jgi:hypothetical protein
MRIGLSVRNNRALLNKPRGTWVRKALFVFCFFCLKFDIDLIRINLDFDIHAARQAAKSADRPKEMRLFQWHSTGLPSLVWGASPGAGALACPVL